MEALTSLLPHKQVLISKIAPLGDIQAYYLRLTLGFSVCHMLPESVLPPTAMPLQV